MFDFIFNAFGWLIRLTYSITNQYLFAILLFALIIEIIISPLQIKQHKNQIKQAKLQPKVRAITKKYDGRTDAVTNQKKQQDIMDLYKKENFSPYGGCLPMLIQLPIIICVYQVIIKPLQYISGIAEADITVLRGLIENLGVSFTGRNDQIEIIRYLTEHGTSQFIKDVPALKDAILPNFNIGPFDLSVTPSITEITWAIAVPVLVFLGSFFSMKIMRKFTYQPPETADAQNRLSMKIMNLTMPLMSTWIAFLVPAAVGLYWVFRNIISVGEKFIFSKIWPIPTFTPEELKAAEKEYSSHEKKRPKSDKPVRSLHRIDFDDEPLPPPTFDDPKEEKEEKKETKVEDDAPEDDMNSGGGKTEKEKIANLLNGAPLKEEDQAEKKEKRFRKKDKNNKIK